MSYNYSKSLQRVHCSKTRSLISALLACVLTILWSTESASGSQELPPRHEQSTLLSVSLAQPVSKSISIIISNSIVILDNLSDVIFTQSHIHGSLFDSFITWAKYLVSKDFFENVAANVVAALFITFASTLFLKFIWKKHHNKAREKSVIESSKIGFNVNGIKKSIGALEFEYSSCHGRDEEVNGLLNLSGDKRAIAILAEAGMGKSAFLMEVQRKLIKNNNITPIFYPFRANDSNLRNPLNMYRWILHNLDPTADLSHKSAEEFKGVIYDLLKNQKDDLYILIDAIDEAAVSRAKSMEDSGSLFPTLFPKGDQNVSKIHLIYTIRGKVENGKTRPVAGTSCEEWFQLCQDKKTGLEHPLQPMQQKHVEEWINADSKNDTSLTQAILRKTEETAYYPLYVYHILKEIQKKRKEHTEPDVILRFVNGLPKSFERYVRDEILRMPRWPFGKWRRLLNRLACAIDQLPLNANEDSMPWQLRRWVFVKSDLEDRKTIEFSHDLYKTWVEDYVNSMPPWWFPFNRYWNAKLSKKWVLFFNGHWARLQVPPWINTIRVHFFGAPYEKAHQWLAEECQINSKNNYPESHLITHLARCGDWRICHEKLTNLTCIQERCAQSPDEVYTLLNDYNLVLDSWPGYERYSPYKEYRVPEWEQKLILKTLMEAGDWSYRKYAVDGWPKHGTHEEICLRTRFASISSEMEIDPFSEEMEKTPEGRIELYFQFVRICSPALRHAKKCPTVVAEQAYRRDKAGLVTRQGDKMLATWDKQQIPHLKYADGTRPNYTPSRPATILTLVGHLGGIKQLALSSDGKHAVSAGEDSKLIVWDLEFGSIVHKLEGHSDMVDYVALSPDGKRAISTSQDGTLILWDLKSGDIKRSLSGHSDLVNHIVFGSDGKKAVSASKDTTLIVWDSESGSLIHKLVGHSGAVNHCVVSPDGKRAISASDDHFVIIWDLEIGSILQKFNKHSGAVNHLALSSDWKRVISASADESVKVWELESGIIIRELQGHLGSVKQVALSPDDSRIISVACGIIEGEDPDDYWDYSSVGGVIIWDLESGSKLHEFNDHSGDPDNFVLSCDGKRAVFSPSSERGAIVVSDLVSGNTISKFEGHSGLKTFIILSPDEKRIISASSDGSIIVSDLQSGGREPKHEGRSYNVYSDEVVMSAVANKCALANWDKEPFVWNLESGKIIHIPENGESGMTQCIALSPDGMRAVTVKGSNRATLWDLSTFNAICELKEEEWMDFITFTPDGKRLISAHQSDVIVWNWETGLTTNKFKRNWGAPIIFSPDGERAITVSEDNRIIVWDFDNGRISRKSDKLSSTVNHLALSSDCKHIVLASEDGSVMVWKFETTDFVHKLGQHSGAVDHVALSPDGKLAYSASRDKRIFEWNLKSGSVRKFKEYSGAINLVSPSPDGKRAYSTCEDNTLSILDFDSADKPLCFYMKGARIAWSTSSLKIVEVSQSRKELRFASIDFGAGAANYATAFTHGRPEESQFSFLCPQCGMKTSVLNAALEVIERLKVGDLKDAYLPESSPSLELPKCVWDEPGLLRDEFENSHSCANCGVVIRFNPWILGEDDAPRSISSNDAISPFNKSFGNLSETTEL